MPNGVGSGTPFAQIRRDHRPEMVHPAANRLVGDRNPALGEQIFDVAKAQCEPEIEPDRLLNDLGREPVSVVADFRHRLGYRTDRAVASPKRRDNTGGTYGDGSVDYEPSLGATEDIDQRKAWKQPETWTIDGEAQGTEDDLVRPNRTLEEENAKRAAVQEAVGRLTELTGARAYGGAYGRMRFYNRDEIRMIDGVRVVGVSR
jgi:hypothetical protein